MMPTGLTVRTDIVNFCNIRCDMCHFGDYTPPIKSRVSLDQFKRRFSILADRISTLYLSCSCEPLCIPVTEFDAIAQYAKNTLKVEDLRLITNAVTLRENYCESLIKNGVSEVHISIDSHVKDTFEKIRRGARYEKVVGNIARLRDMKAACEADRPVMQFNVVLMRSNIEQMLEFIEFAGALGCQQISFFHLIPKKKEHLDEVLFSHQQLTNRYFDEIRAACGRHGIEIKQMPPNFREGDAPDDRNSSAPRRCRFIDGNDIFVVDNGDLRPCGFWYGESSFGNLDADSFETIWNAPGYARFRDEMNRGVASRHCCQICPSMGGGDVNDPRTFDVH